MGLLNEFIFLFQILSDPCWIYYHDKYFGDEFYGETLETKKDLEKDSTLSPLVLTRDSLGLSDLILEEESGSEKVEGLAGFSWRWLSFRRL